MLVQRSFVGTTRSTHFSTRLFGVTLAMPETVLSFLLMMSNVKLCEGNIETWCVYRKLDELVVKFVVAIVTQHHALLQLLHHCSP